MSQQSSAPSSQVLATRRSGSCLLYGRRNLGPGPSGRLAATAFAELIDLIGRGQLPAWLLDRLPQLRVSSYSAQSQATATLIGFPEPCADQLIGFSLAEIADRYYIGLEPQSSGGGSPAERRLLYELALALPPYQPIEVVWTCASASDVEQMLDREDLTKMSLINHLDRRQASPADELSYAGMANKNVTHFSDLIAAADLYDFFLYSRNPRATLIELAEQHCFSLTRPLASYR